MLEESVESKIIESEEQTGFMPNRIFILQSIIEKEQMNDRSNVCRYKACDTTSLRTMFSSPIIAGRFGKRFPVAAR